MYQQLYYLIIIEIISLFVKTIHVNTKDNNHKEKITLSHILISNASMICFSLLYFIMHGIIIYVLCSYNLDIFAWIYLGLCLLVLCIRIFLLLSPLLSNAVPVTTSRTVPIPQPQAEPIDNPIDSMLKKNLGLDSVSGCVLPDVEQHASLPGSTRTCVFKTDIHPNKKLFPTKKKIKDLYK